ncbi:hypothetical protein QR680_016087 [Steinernema hermaphroditum]|uniref:Uncharacterized protein n=1 Tax=Steinernema hermaphroditum TaxID=289476 RepID=A0AA39HAY0_9BILA|nr:hypothetical protein QR680_016087 [Steinernema hermaphroditum]
MPDDFLNQVIFYIVSFFVVPSGVLFFYVVIRTSPPSIHLYRNNLLNLFFWAYIDLLPFGLLLQPVFELHDGIVCVKACGLGLLLHPKVIYPLYFFFGVATSNAFMALWLCFLYRYAQLASSGLTTYLSSSYGLMFCFLIHLATTVMACFVAYHLLSVVKELETNGDFLICMQTVESDSILTTILNLYGIVEALFIMISIGTFTVLSVRILRSQRKFLSEATYRLQMRLTVNLILLAILPVVFDLLSIMAFATHMPFVDLFLTCVITLAFVTPYRKAIASMMGRKRASSISLLKVIEGLLKSILGSLGGITSHVPAVGGVVGNVGSAASGIADQASNIGNVAGGVAKAVPSV